MGVRAPIDPAVSEAPELLLGATMAELRKHAPFDAMAEPDLGFLAGRLKIRYYPAGTTILKPDDGRVARLHIIQRGRIEAFEPKASANGIAAFRLSEGESFPVGALIAERATTLVYRALDDAFCYVLEAAHFKALMARSRELQMFCTRRLAHLLEQSRRATREEYGHRAATELGMSSPLATAVRREPLTLPEGASLRTVLETMKGKRIGSVVLTGADGRPSGIFTQTDVLDRVALGGASLDAPVSAMMTRNPLALAAASPLAEAAQVMARHGFRHLLVEDQGKLVGVVSERDLFSLQRLSMQGVRKEVRRAAGVDELAFAARDVRRLATAMLAQGIAAEQLTQFVTALNDAITVRAIDLARDRHELPGCAWAWMGLGSEGRMEQTLATDQDNAIVFQVPGGQPVEEARQALLAFARDVNGVLDACGFPLCTGEIMAGNPKWCLTLDEWRARYDDWMRNAQPEALLNASIFFDFRTLHSAATEASETLVPSLRRFLLDKVKDRPSFLRQMATNALQVRPPLGFFGDLVVEEGEQGGTINLKTYGSRPFVDCARILALAAGVEETNTAERLRAVGPKVRMSADDVGAAVDAFHFIQMLRLRNQDAGEHEGRAAGANRISPESLNSLDRRILKEALRQARKLQNRVALDYQL
jgi:CBS domain-containing protein